MAAGEEVGSQADAASGRPLRILTVLAYYHPHWTGLTMFARRIAEGLAAGGAEVTVLCSRHDDDLPTEEVSNGVRIIRVPARGRLSRTPLMPGFPVALGRLVRHHDVVHLHSPMAEAGLVAAACRLAGRPLVVTHQGDVVMPAGLANQAIERTMTALLGATFRMADRVVTHNADYAATSLTARAGARACAIVPPVVFAPPPPGATAAFAARHGLEHGPVVAFAGRWVREKGFDVLLRAAPLVLASHPDARFLFAGERNVAYEDFSERCRPLGDALGDRLVEVGLLLDPEELAAFYGAADVFVLPSRSDCHAAVQVEALLCGTPLVASDIPGARSVVHRTGAGVLVAPEDPVALAAGIVAVLDDPGRFADAVAAAPACYDPAVGLRAYAELLQDVVAEPRRPRRSRRARTDRRTPGEVVGSRPADPAGRVERLLAGELDPAYRRRVRWLLARLPAGPGRVLDAGTGLGNVVHVAERSRPDLSWTGVDRSGERLGRALADGVAAPVAVADLLDLPHPDATFDAVLCSEVLEHLEDDRAALRELVRVLRPGGRLLVSVPHADFPWTWDPIARARQALGLAPLRSGPWIGIWTNHVRLYRLDELVVRLEEAGLVVDEAEPQTHHALPFTHLALYGLGRALVERGLLPAGAAASVSRHRDLDAPAAPGPRTPLGLLRRTIDAIDRRNDALPAGTRTHVGLVASAHRPGPTA